MKFPYHKHVREIEEDLDHPVAEWNYQTLIVPNDFYAAEGLDPRNLGLFSTSEQLKRNI